MRALVRHTLHRFTYQNHYADIAFICPIPLHINHVSFVLGIIHMNGCSLREHDATVFRNSWLDRQFQALDLLMNSAQNVAIYGQRTPRCLGDQAYGESTHMSSQVGKVRLAALGHHNPILQQQLTLRNQLNKEYVFLLTFLCFLFTQKLLHV